MTDNSTRPGLTTPVAPHPARAARLPSVPGLIEGSMAIDVGPAGHVSMRVVIGENGPAGKRDLLELVISAEHVRYLSHALDGDRVPSFPCRIGYSREAVISAA
jgi:hypothetical protein